MYGFINHLIKETDTNVFHPDAKEILFDDEKLREFEKSLASKK